MVRVNFRMNPGVEKIQILQFFKEIGYKLIGTSENSIKIEDEVISTDVFIRNTTSGRFHIHLAFGRKHSGPIKYPQVKVFAHYDIIKIINGKVRHFADITERRVLREMYRIGRELEKAKLGYLEYKDRWCAHATIRGRYKENLLGLINKEYKKYEKGKYRKRLKGSQYTLSISKQEKFIHLVCVHAKYNKTGHGLVKPKAVAELNRIIKFAKSDIKLYVRG